MNLQLYLWYLWELTDIPVRKTNAVAVAKRVTAVAKRVTALDVSPSSIGERVASVIIDISDMNFFRSDTFPAQFISLIFYAAKALREPPAPKFRTDTYTAESYVQITSRHCQAGRLNSNEEAIAEISGRICAAVDFLLVAIETSGVGCAASANCATLPEIRRNISQVRHKPRSTSFMRQRSN